VLCFTGSQWPLFFPPRNVGEVLLCSPKGLPRTLEAEQQAAPSSRTKAIADHLARSLKPAAPSAASPVSDWAGEPTAHEPASPPVAASVAWQGGTSSRCRCGQAMVVRTRRADGTRFLGCSSFPSCRNTRALAAD
jgi:hypothetical protein